MSAPAHIQFSIDGSPIVGDYPIAAFAGHLVCSVDLRECAHDVPFPPVDIVRLFNEQLQAFVRCGCRVDPTPPQVAPADEGIVGWSVDIAFLASPEDTKYTKGQYIGALARAELLVRRAHPSFRVNRSLTWFRAVPDKEIRPAYKPPKRSRPAHTPPRAQ